MKLLMYRNSIDYSGSLDHVYGIFSDDYLALQALEDLKSILQKEENLPLDKWEKNKYNLGYTLYYGGGSAEIYLEEMEENKLIV